MSWEDQFSEKVGEYFRNAREKKGLKQSEVANQVGISQSHYSNIERGTRGVSFQLAGDICDTLDLSTDGAIQFTKMRKPRVIRPKRPFDPPTKEGE